ncbi:hypothetical protein HK101_002323 [Irineochytrium annulatum]|nr:hypothetical protein HK101_002323 [Irineochytrium annulatum]
MSGWGASSGSWGQPATKQEKDGSAWGAPDPAKAKKSAAAEADAWGAPSSTPTATAAKTSREADAWGNPTNAAPAKAVEDDDTWGTGGSSVGAGNEHMHGDIPELDEHANERRREMSNDDRTCRICSRRGHIAANCPTRNAPREKLSDEELAVLWNEVVEKDKVGDFDEVKAAIIAYMDGNPEETWQGCEAKLREVGLKTHILPEPRQTHACHNLVDNQGVGDHRYEIIFVRNPRIVAKLLKTDESRATYASRIADAGLLMERRRVEGKYVLPDWHMDTLSDEQRNVALGNCLRCGSEGHVSKDCTEEKPEPNKRVGECYKCGEKGHSFRSCPNPDPKRIQTGCRNCGQEGHRASDCPEPEKIICRRCNEEGHKGSECPSAPKFECRRCGQEGHKAADCDQENTRSIFTCRRCNEEGHKASECPQPDTRTCHTCGQPGHKSSGCSEPRRSRPRGDRPTRESNSDSQVVSVW